MANSNVNVTEGSGKKVATYSVIEDSSSKEIQRVAINSSGGTELGTSSAPVRTDPTGTTTQPVSLANGTVLNLSDGTDSLAINSDGSLSTLLVTGTAIIGRVGHDITGLAQGVKTVTTAGTDEALAASTSCKRVVIQSQTDNTGLIAVGATGVDATEATGTGVILYPGDIFELEIDNLSDVFIDSTVSGEGVRYTYFT